MVYINHILLYLVVVFWFFFSLLPILFCPTHPCYTDISGGQNDGCHSKNNTDSKSSFCFPDAVWQKCGFVRQNKFQSSSGGYHSMGNLELLNLQCPLRRNPVALEIPWMHPVSIQKQQGHREQLTIRIQKPGHAGSGNTCVSFTNLILLYDKSSAT